MTFAVLAGLLLSWFQVEGLRRNTARLLNTENQKSARWALAFGLRWGAVALMFWVGLNLFRNNIVPFVLSFVLSGIPLRYVYRRTVYAQ